MTLIQKLKLNRAKHLVDIERMDKTNHYKHHRAIAEMIVKDLQETIKTLENRKNER